MASDHTGARPPFARQSLYRLLALYTYDTSPEALQIDHRAIGLLTTRLQFSYITVRMIVGGLVPLILLGIVVLTNRALHERLRNTLATVAAVPCLLQVFSIHCFRSVNWAGPSMDE